MIVAALGAALGGCAPRPTFRSEEWRDPPPDTSRCAFVLEYDVRCTASVNLERSGDRDTVYIRRVRMFEQLAASISTDSLARLYVTAIAAPDDSATFYVTQWSCEMTRMFRRHGLVASTRAITRMEDSLFAIPRIRDQWNAAHERWGLLFITTSGCGERQLPAAPDSLDFVPRRTASPSGASPDN